MHGSTYIPETRHCRKSLSTSPVEGCFSQDANMMNRVIFQNRKLSSCSGLRLFKVLLVGSELEERVGEDCLADGWVDHEPDEAHATFPRHFLPLIS
jgi:hypothetical protein